MNRGDKLSLRGSRVVPSHGNQSFSHRDNTSRHNGNVNIPAGTTNTNIPNSVSGSQPSGRYSRQHNWNNVNGRRGGHGSGRRGGPSGRF